MIPVVEKKPAKVMILNWRDEQELKDRIAAVVRAEREKNPNITYAMVAGHIMRKGLEAVENE